ncbi:MAG: hypothetical protein ACRD0N_11385 [Acidimicrobiales bacterium]
MTEIRLRPGPYRPDTQLPTLLGKEREPPGDPSQPFAVYEGPHGPMEGYLVEDRRATVVRGPALAEPVHLAWGLDAGADRDWLRRLMNGISCRVGSTEVVLRQRRFGFTRAARGVQISAGDRAYLARLRRYKTYVVERAGGEELARYPRPGQEVGWLRDDADQLEAVLVFLLDASGLRLEPAASLP